METGERACRTLLSSKKVVAHVADMADAVLAFLCMWSDGGLDSVDDLSCGGSAGAGVFAHSLAFTFDNNCWGHAGDLDEVCSFLPLSWVRAERSPFAPTQSGDLFTSVCYMLLEMRVDTARASKVKGQAVDLWSLLEGLCW